MAEHNHSDLLGQPLEIGDCVVYPSHNNMTVGTVTKINPKMIGVASIRSKSTKNKYPTDIVKVSGPEVTMYLLLNNK